MMQSKIIATVTATSTGSKTDAKGNNAVNNGHPQKPMMKNGRLFPALSLTAPMIIAVIVDIMAVIATIYDTYRGFGEITLYI